MRYKLLKQEDNKSNIVCNSCFFLLYTLFINFKIIRTKSSNYIEK